MRMRGSTCPEAWACWLLAKLPVPERVGSKVLLIPTKSRFPFIGRVEALGEQQEPPLLEHGEVSEQVLPFIPNYKRIGKRQGLRPFYLPCLRNSNRGPIRARLSLWMI